MAEGRRVDLPLRAANRYVLPEVCLVTGSREAVEWRRVRLAWAPGWTVIPYVLFFVPCIPTVLRLLCIPLAIILRIVVGRKVHVELPFEEGRFVVWRIGRVAQPLATVMGLCVGLPAGVYTLGSGYVAIGAVLVGAGLAVPVVTWLAVGFRRGPVTRGITADRVLLDLPSEQAAVEIRRVLSGHTGERASLEGSACALHPDSPAAIVCSRCGGFACQACARQDLGAAMCGGCGELRDSHVSRERLTDGPQTDPIVLAPPGATCGRHGEREATVTCSRCGAAMCEECVRERPGTRVPLCIPCRAREM